MQTDKKMNPDNVLGDIRSSQPTEGKLFIQMSPLMSQEDFSSIGKSAQCSELILEEEKKRNDFISSLNNYEEFNNLLLNKIFTTYNNETSDAIINK